MTNDQLGAGAGRGRTRRVLAVVVRALSATHPCAYTPWAVGVAAWPTCETSPGLHAQVHAAVFGPGLAGDQLGAGTPDPNPHRVREQRRQSEHGS